MGGGGAAGGSGRVQPGRRQVVQPLRPPAGGHPAEPPVGTRTPHVAVMSLHDFQAIVTAAAHYWEEVQRDARLRPLTDEAAP